MKSERLYDSITNIDDELIMKASSPANIKKRHKKRAALFISAAAVFIIAAALSTAALSGGFSPDSLTTQVPGEEQNNVQPPVICASPLAKADYPERVPYPYIGTGENQLIDHNAADKWFEDKRNINKISVETDNINVFSGKIMSEFLSGRNDENKAVSPLNIYMAFSMLADMSAGETQEQLFSLLGVTSREELCEQANKIWQKNYRDDGVMKSVLGNSVWLSDTAAYNESTVARIARSYYADVFSGKMGSTEYNAAINSWIREHTDGLIPSDVKTNPQTVLALASSLLYTSKWSQEFNTNNTREGVFRAPSGDMTVEFMNATRQMDYYWSENYCAIALPMRIGGYMWFILPDEGTDADELFADGSLSEFLTGTDKYEADYKNKKFIRVNMSVPKFDITCESELTDGFEALGISDITNPVTADFSPLLSDSSIPVWVDKASHGVRVKIDEEGVTAAAYTVLMEAGSTAPPEEIVDFILDRPFAFAVTLDSSTVLFAGVVNTP